MDKIPGSIFGRHQHRWAHFWVEIRKPFRLIPHWTRLYFEKSWDVCHDDSQKGIVPRFFLSNAIVRGRPATEVSKPKPAR